MLPALRVIHVIADLFWIGSICAVALLLAKGPGDARQRGGSARLIYQTIAVPSFVAAFLAGAILLGTNLLLYFKTTHYMHGKLPLTIGVIAIHHILGSRAKKMEAGEIQDAGSALQLGGALAVMAVLATGLVMLKPF